MKNILISAVTIITIIVSAMFLITGCSDENKAENSGQNNGNPELSSVYPPSGAVGVDRGDSIHIKFNMPMDTSSVRMSFHMAGGPGMREWMDSLDDYMGGMMQMEHMMRWMDSIEYDGGFHWNGRMDSCIFVPTSEMMPNSEYMIYMYGEMRGMNGRMMETDSLQYDGFMHHFTTRQ